VLRVFNIRGREVSELTNGIYQPGEYEILFDATGLPSGIYVYRIQMRDFTAAGKMVKVE
jgi:hypothetical protein